MKILSSFVLFFIVFQMYGQDILTLQDGQEILVRVKEVGIEEIKYLRFDNLEGPIYSILKSDVLLIVYSNGVRDVFKKSDNKINLRDNFNRDRQQLINQALSYEQALIGLHYYQGNNKISKKAFIEILKTDTEAYSHYEPMRIILVGKQVFTGGAVFGLALTMILNSPLSILTASGCLGFGGLARISSQKAKFKLGLAVQTFNENLVRF